MKSILCCVLALLIIATDALSSPRSLATRVWTEDTTATLFGENNNELFGVSNPALDGELLVIGAQPLVGGAFANGFAKVYMKEDGSFTFKQTLHNDDSTSNDRFGSPTVASNKRVAISAIQQINDVDDETGAVYVFDENPENGDWIQTVKLLPPGGSPGLLFGHGLAMKGDVLIAGAPRETVSGENSGAAYVFEYVSEKWTFKQKLFGDEASTHFGADIAFDGNRIVIGSPGYGSDIPGSIFVFTQDDSDDWIQEGKLEAGLSGEEFGAAVAIYGDTIVGSAPLDTKLTSDPNFRKGSVYVFEYDVDDGWQEQTKLQPDDIQRYDAFGSELAIEGNTLVVGSKWEDDNGPDAGAVYVFVREGSQWIVEQKLTTSISTWTFGGAVALQGRLIIATSQESTSTKRGTVHFFTTPLTLDPWEIDSPDVQQTGDAQVTLTHEHGVGDEVGTLGTLFKIYTSNTQLDSAAPDFDPSLSCPTMGDASEYTGDDIVSFVFQTLDNTADTKISSLAFELSSEINSLSPLYVGQDKFLICVRFEMTNDPDGEAPDFSPQIVSFEETSLLITLDTDVNTINGIGIAEVRSGKPVGNNNAEVELYSVTAGLCEPDLNQFELVGTTKVRICMSVNEFPHGFLKGCKNLSFEDVDHGLTQNVIRGGSVIPGLASLVETLPPDDICPQNKCTSMDVIMMQMFAISNAQPSTIDLRGNCEVSVGDGRRRMVRVHGRLGKSSEELYDAPIVDSSFKFQAAKIENSGSKKVFFSLALVSCFFVTLSLW